MITTSSNKPSQDEILRTGMGALRRELGLVGMVRFLQQLIKPSGDYTAERAELLGNPSVAEIAKAIERRKAAEQGASS